MRIKVQNKKSAITLPKGFKASGIGCGIKRSGKFDLALLYSEKKAKAAAVFTTNRLKAWPVIIGKKHITSSLIQAVIVNSGNANCANGEKNKEKVKKCCKVLAEELGISPYEVFPSSTGIIGRDLPLDKILTHIPRLVKGLSKTRGHSAARAILTTDTRTKEASVSFLAYGKKITISAMAKGSGMINPNMATMLVFITTDLNISKALLNQALRDVNECTFNMICIDNDRSTNDTVLILANGAAGNESIIKKGKDYYNFVNALEVLCSYIAKEIVCDGEGVTKVCKIFIDRAKNEKHAKLAARSIAHSMLFKTALHGSDPNWGRIVAVLGSLSDIDCNFNRMKVAFDKYIVYKNGKPLNRNLPGARKALKKKEVDIHVDLASGRAGASFLTSDLSREYIAINSYYTT